MRRFHACKTYFLAVALALLSCSVMATSQNSQLITQRQLFLQAETALADQQLTQFSALRQQLENYPLAPYLDYQALQQRLALFPHKEIESFLDQHENSHLARRLGRDWLTTLAEAKRWEDYQYYFEKIQPGSDELRCYFLHARLLSGDDSALEEVAPLWNVGRSQLNACDPVFDVWMDKGKLTDELAWERHEKAMKAGNLNLARYVASKMSPTWRQYAELYRRIHRQPDYLAKTQDLNSTNPKAHDIILHGISRYALRDPLAALQLWQRYDASHLFATDKRQQIQDYLLLHLVVEGQMSAAEKLMKQREKITDNDLIAWLVRDALRNEDWPRVYNSIQLFQGDYGEQNRWLYWRARALDQLNKEDPQYGSPEQIYARLALSRSYYGFLAADRLGRDYTLAHRPAAPSTDILKGVQELAAVQRARELFLLGRELPARREWASATRNMEPMQLLAVGKLAEQWGWYYKGIQAMIAARYWDDLQLRFPFAYAEDITRAAAKTQIESPFLYAIARQESAFAASARSPTGAMGLMQLMPTTARHSAREMGLVHGKNDLRDPAHNIQLGSHYLHQLLQEFNGNRILATAAYNAGPYRVKEWLENSNEGLPHDIWIETIPYRETRGYVQNVLSYSVIYAQRMGKPWPLMEDRQENEDDIEMQQSTLLGSGSAEDAS